jgi:hypothetical protein
LLDALLHVVNLLAELSLLVVMLLVVVVMFFPLFFCNVKGLWISLQMVP